MLTQHRAASNAGIRAASPVHQSFSGRYFQNEGANPMHANIDYALDEMEALMPLVGVGMTRKAERQVMSGDMIDFAMDSIQQPLTTPSITTPIQFLQNWLPGIIEIITAKQSADEIMGRSTVGSWEDAQIVQQVIALTGAATPYTDLGNVPLSNWNQTFVDRTVVRFELGLRVGNLEEAQAARVRVDSAGQKRRSDAIQLEIQRNAVAFYGYNSGNGKTYGFLNDPNLPAYVNNPNGVWASASFANIQQDLLTAFQSLRTQSKGRITPNKDPITLVLPTSCVDYLAVSTDFGMSVWAWLKEFYPNVRVVDAPQLDGANGGANVLYVFADSVQDSGSDGGATWIQVVPATFQLLGVQKMAKGYEEDYSNATAGAFCKRPYAVLRMTGI
jgi:hypothetical protein